MLFKYDKRFYVAVLVIILFNILLLNLPLTSVFGFEFSALNSLLLIIVSGLLIISYLKRKEAYLNKILIILPILLIIPMVISVINSLLITTCSLAEGFLFYVVITTPSVLIGSTIGLLSFYISPKYPRIVLVILLVSIAVIPVIEIYYNPQIYFYNPFVGYYPGTIYDEGLEVSLRLVLYRLINIIFFLSIFYSITKIISHKSRINKYLYLLFISIVALLFIYCSSSLGLSTTKNRIESTLKGKCYSQHFEIIYDTSIDTALLKDIIVNHEYYYFELKKYFMDEPPRLITSFIFKDNFQKGELFGSENADVAKPWLYQIYTTAGSYDNNLRHEIAHIFSASFGTGPFRIAHDFNPALIEGIAEAAAPLYNTWYIDQIASVAYNNNYKFPIVNLYKGFNFFGQTSGLSYVYAGSFTNYLINKYGIEKFKDWYGGKPFFDLYNINLKDMADKYYVYLKEIGLTDKKYTAQYYFSRQTIFSKFCPRYIANLLELGWSNYNKKNYSKAEKIYSHINSITNNYSALYGLVLSKIELKKEKEALTLIDKEISKYENTSYYFSLELLRGDLLIRNNMYNEAKIQYSQLNYQDPDLHYNYLSKLRIDLSQNDSLIYNYIIGSDSIKYTLLKSFNFNVYNYASFPVIIDLAVSLHKSYKEVLSIFSRNVLVDDIYSSYAAYYLSRYMMENLDFQNAKNLAELAVGFNNKDGIQIFMRSHLLKTDWIYSNYLKVMDNVKYVSN
ncbi:MAG: hypothetical protein P4L35_13825 [Ignavibacteriaceae bacterium]|nr:hypothetical protein [Ignavibacteriaceae bacterium]